MKLTGLHRSGVPIGVNDKGVYYLLVSRHRTLFAARRQNDKLFRLEGYRTPIVRIGNWYYRTQRTNAEDTQKVKEYLRVHPEVRGTRKGGRR